MISDCGIFLVLFLFMGFGLIVIFSIAATLSFIPIYINIIMAILSYISMMTSLIYMSINY